MKFYTRLRSHGGINEEIQWFQQDGATPHTANFCMQWLDEKFPWSLTSKRRDPEWAPQSPDLNPPDFYLWEFLKDTVSENHPTSIAELKQATTSKIRKIKNSECVKAINNFARRINECLKQNGDHLELVLKYINKLSCWYYLLIF